MMHWRCSVPSYFAKASREEMTECSDAFVHT